MTNEEESDLAQTMRTELHELSQPLTTLRCRLELALLVSPPAQANERSAKVDNEELSMHRAVQEAVDDLRRIFVIVERMRKAVLAKVSP